MADSSSVIPAEYLTAARDKLSIEQRVALARKDDFFKSGKELSASDREVLRHILQMVARDVEVRVRQALAETLAEKPDAPHDIVLGLAKDDDLVADPILRLSEILKPADLVAIIENQKSQEKMAAIAARRHVPPSVCMALIDHGGDRVAGQLLQNPGADISESGLHRIVDRHGNSAAIQKGVVNRGTLPATVIEKVVTLASSELLTRLIERHNLPENVSTKLALEMRDRAILGFTFGLSSDGMSNLVDQLISEDRLNASLVLRCLTVGNIELIVHAIALRCQLGIQYVRDRLIQAVPADVQKLWVAAGLPANYLQLALVASNVLTEAHRTGAKWTADECRAQIVERFFSDCDDLARQLSADDMKFLQAARGAGAKDIAALTPA